MSFPLRWQGYEVPQFEVGTLLKCTTGERKWWTEEGKLPVAGHGTFRKAGAEHIYQLYERRGSFTLTTSDIEAWRNEHKVLVGERRKASARLTAAARKAKKMKHVEV